MSQPAKPSLYALTGSSEPPSDSPVDDLLTLLEEFQKVDITSPNAELNETTISDNNGGRIEL